MIKILQINVDGGQVAQDLMDAKSKELNIDVLVVCEQYRNIAEENGWFYDEGGKSAVAVLCQDIPIELIGPPKDIGFRWVMIKGIRIYSCYWSPNANIESFAGFLDGLEVSVRSMETPVIIAGDFNAKAAEWGDHREDDLGRLVMEFMSSLNLVAKNNGSIPTFERVYKDGRVAYSYIDITLVSESIAQLVTEWKVLKDYNGSLHRFITYNVADRTDPIINHRVGSKWSWRKYDPKKLQNYLASVDLPLTDVSAPEGAARLDKYIKDACDSCMPKGTYKGGKCPVYWWTQNIANLRKECLANRRKCKRNRQNNAALQAENLERYKEARKKLKWEIQKSKKECWGELYTLFPSQASITWPVQHEAYNFPLITIAEIKNWAKKYQLERLRVQMVSLIL